MSPDSKTTNQTNFFSLECICSGSKKKSDWDINEDFKPCFFGEKWVACVKENQYWLPFLIFPKVKSQNNMFQRKYFWSSSTKLTSKTLKCLRKLKPKNWKGIPNSYICKKNFQKIGGRNILLVFFGKSIHFPRYVRNHSVLLNCFLKFSKRLYFILKRIHLWKNLQISERTIMYGNETCKC